MPDSPVLPEGEPNGPSRDGRLDSWKEISAYLNRGIRTVERWEREEGLPVHRLHHDKRGSVYAYKRELDLWWNSRGSIATTQSFNRGAHLDRRSSQRRGRVFWTASIGIVPLVVLAVSVLYRSVAEPSESDRQIVRLTSDASLTMAPAASDDGKLVAYASDRGGDGNLSIWVQPLAGGDPVRVTQHNANDSDPAFSPDGNIIAFRSELEGGGIYIVSASGGQARRVADGGRRPRFSPDGRWIAYWDRDESWGPGRVYVVPFQGGAPRQVRPDFDDAHYPVWAADSRHILFCGTRRSNSPPDEHDWWVTLWDSSEPPVKTTFAHTEMWRRSQYYAGLASMGGDRVGSPSDWTGDEVLFSAKNNDAENVWSVKISPKTWLVNSAPRRVTEGPGLHVQPVSAGDRVIFTSAHVVVNVWALAVNGNQGTAIGMPKRLTFSLYDSQPSVSDDGRLVAFISNRSGRRAVWLKDMETGRENMLALPENASVSQPKVSRDGSRVVYRDIPEREQVLYAAGQDLKPVRICEDCGRPTDWSEDNTRILFEPGAKMPSVRELDLRTGRFTEMLAHPQCAIHSARYSPDGKWLAFHANESSKAAQVIVAPVRHVPRKDWIPITDSTASAHNPCWSRDGRLLYFLSESDGFRCILAQRLDASKKPIGEPFCVHHAHAASRSLLMNVRANADQVGLSLGGDMLVFAMDGISGNLWSVAR